MLWNVFLANLLNLLLRLFAKIVATIPTIRYACPFATLLAPPVKKWNIFRNPLKLGWLCKLLWPTEYRGSDTVEPWNLSLERLCSFCPWPCKTALRLPCEEALFSHGEQWWAVLTENSKTHWPTASVHRQACEWGHRQHPAPVQVPGWYCLARDFTQHQQRSGQAESSPNYWHKECVEIKWLCFFLSHSVVGWIVTEPWRTDVRWVHV